MVWYVSARSTNDQQFKSSSTAAVSVPSGATPPVLGAILFYFFFSPSFRERSVSLRNQSRTQKRQPRSSLRGAGPYPGGLKIQHIAGLCHGTQCQPFALTASGLIPSQLRTGERYLKADRKRPSPRRTEGLPGPLLSVRRGQKPRGRLEGPPQAGGTRARWRRGVPRGRGGTARQRLRLGCAAGAERRRKGGRKGGEIPRIPPPPVPAWGDTAGPSPCAVSARR